MPIAVGLAPNWRRLFLMTAEPAYYVILRLPRVPAGQLPQISQAMPRQFLLCSRFFSYAFAARLHD